MKLILWFLTILTLCTSSKSTNKSDAATHSTKSGSITLSEENISSLKTLYFLTVMKALSQGTSLASITPLVTLFNYMRYRYSNFIKPILFTNILLAMGDLGINVILKMQLRRIPSKLFKAKDRENINFGIFFALIKLLVVIPLIDRKCIYVLTESWCFLLLLVPSVVQLMDAILFLRKNQPLQHK